MKLKNIFKTVITAGWLCCGAAAALMTLAACSDDDPIGSLATVSLDQTYLVIPETGGDATLTVKATKPDTESIGTVKVTVDDGETTFTQRFGIIITGETTAVGGLTVDFDQIDAAKREFFTTDGRQVTELKSHGVYVMKVTDKEGTVHSAKIIAK
jgi:hypothetical protein